MRILITGTLGYVAPSVIEALRRDHPAAELVGVDTGWFASSLVRAPRAPETLLDRQVYRDVRDLGPEEFAGVTHVVHLAAVSNDPMGDRFTAVTEDINHGQSVRLAALAKEAGARGFVFASSASVYGAGSDTPRTEDSPVAPQTAYARSKIATERDVLPMADDRFAVTCLRFSTACGWSPRPRLDLVLNDFVASALTKGSIVVLSDGTPWRPLIHVSDMARAISWAVGAARESEAPPGVTTNVGRDDWNFQIKDLAEAVAATLGGIDVSINTEAPADRRSYRVDFDRWARLAPGHQPRATVQQTVAELAAGLSEIPDLDAGFRTSPLVRLQVLDRLTSTGLLDERLRWTTAAGS